MLHAAHGPPRNDEAILGATPVTSGGRPEHGFTLRFHATTDIGGPAALFDGDSGSLYRTPDIDPAVITLSFDAPRTITGFRTLLSRAGGNPAYRWRVETADSLAELATRSGSYRHATPWRPPTCSRPSCCQARSLHGMSASRSSG